MASCVTSFTTNASGREVLQVSGPDGSAITIHRQGAHVTSWRNAAGEELLYLSPVAVFENKKAIRGGVPVIFPQFSDMGPMSTHGFARIRQWDVKCVEADAGKVVLVLQAGPNDSGLSRPDHHVALEYTVAFSNKSLSLAMEVKNLSESVAFPFTFALHTYFPVRDVTKANVIGVDATPYLDNLQGRARCPPTELGHITREVDRVYLGQVTPVVLHDPIAQRCYVITGENLNDVVVWNPWKDKCARMSDLPADGYHHFVCVEHGTIDPAVEVSPASTWRGKQRITLEPTP